MGAEWGGLLKFVFGSQVFFDDSVQNISAAKQLGIRTVLVSTGSDF